MKNERQREACLRRAIRTFLDDMTATVDLPAVLAQLIEQGEQGLALVAVQAWGQRSMRPARILAACRMALCPWQAARPPALTAVRPRSGNSQA